MDISVVVPLYNEEENVLQLYIQISSALKSLSKTYEIILVDDGSKDNTFKKIEAISDNHVVAIKLRKNFGQSSAWMAGFENASGNIIVTLDGDLQNDPKDIPLLLEKINQGYDCVSGWRYKRHDNLRVKIFSRFSNFLRHILINDQINDSGCSLKAYKRECLKDIELYGEMHRYIISLVSLKGFKVGEVKVQHHARKNGKSKYGIYKIMKGFLDLWGVWFWQKFSARPLHLFGVLGLLVAFFGFFSGAYSVYLKIFRNIDLSDTFLPDVAVFFVMIGLQLFIFGILCDIMVKTYYRTNNSKPYNIEKVVRKK